MNNVIEKILTMTRRSEKFLVVAAVRFMRTIISRNVGNEVLSRFPFVLLGLLTAATIGKLEVPLSLQTFDIAVA